MSNKFAGYESIESALKRGVKIEKIPAGVSVDSWRNGQMSSTQSGKVEEGIYRQEDGEFLTTIWIKDRLVKLGVFSSIAEARRARRDKIIGRRKD